MKIKDVALMFLGLCVTVLAVLLFTKKDNSELIKAKDETIKAIRQERDSYVKMKDDLAVDIAKYRERDSMLNLLFLDNQRLHEEFEKELKDVPVNIRRIAGNDDSIRAAFARFE